MNTNRAAPIKYSPGKDEKILSFLSDLECKCLADTDQVGEAIGRIYQVYWQNVSFIGFAFAHAEVLGLNL